MERRTLIGSLALAGLLLSLAFGSPARAQKGGKGGGKDAGVVFDVAVVNPENTLYDAPTWLPTCTATADASKPGKKNYTALFDRHDLCATITTSTGAQLTDDITIQVTTTKNVITSIQVHGQDVIGEDGIAHESEAVAITPPVTPSASGFTVHVHVDNLPIWKLSGHLGGPRVEIVGYISIGDLVYTPQ